MSYFLDEDRNVWVRGKAESFAYSDGTEIEARLLRAVQNSVDRSVFSSEIQEHIVDWASEYHFSKSRHCLLRPLGIKRGDRVLELGCGCGALTRYLGEIGASVVAVEGSIHRATIASARCDGLENVTVYCDDLTQFECEEKFDWVLLMGVAEYAPVFSCAEDPVQVYLDSAKACAKDSGRVVVAIENQLGLKYLNGCREDHLGREYFGVHDLYGDDTPITFGRRELEDRLRVLGCRHINFYYPFPDYKVPNVVIADQAFEDDRFRVSDLLVGAHSRDYTGSRLRSFDEGLVYPVLERNNLIQDLSNSFLVVASNTAVDDTFLAASYAVNRAAKFVTETKFLNAPGSELIVEKRRLVEGGDNNSKYSLAVNTLSHKLYHSPYILGSQMAISLFKARYVAKDLSDCVDALEPWFYFLYSQAFSSVDSPQLEWTHESVLLPGDFVDCTPLNLILKSNREIEYFDREWVCEAPIPFGWVVCRGVLSALQVGASKHSVDVEAMTGVVESLFLRVSITVSSGAIKSWLKLEAEFQSLIRHGELPDQNALDIFSLFGCGGITFANEEVVALSASLLEESRHSEELVIMRGTRSWRLTRPLRYFSGLLSGARQRMLRHSLVCATRTKLGVLRREIRYYLANELNGGVISYFTDGRVEAANLPVNFHACEDVEWPEIDISVVLYNSRQWVESFFSSLNDQQYPLCKINMVLVDHGSVDGTLEALEVMERKYGAKFCSWKVLRQANKGFGAGHDLAISESRSPLFMVANPDLQFDAHAITHLVRCALSDKENVASWECRQKPFEHPKYYDPVSLEVAWSSHACALIRRTAYEMVGGYERKIFMYGEDVELSYRFRARGFKLRYCPHSVVWHYTYEEESQIKPLQHYGSILSNFYIRARFGGLKDVALILPLMLSLFIRPSAFPGAKRGYLPLLLSFLKNAPSFLATRAARAGFFPFRYWDYEMVREGAFQSLGALPEVCPKVSIVVRTMAGRELFLRQALRSISNQTYPNIEVVIPQDGGDSSRLLAEEFGRKSGLDIQFVGLPQAGRSVAGNAGLKSATGEYLMFLDDDDLLFADHVEVIMCQILARKDIKAAYTLAWEVFTSERSELPNNYKESIIQTEPSHRQPFDRSLIVEKNYIPIQSIIFSRELYESAGGFNTSLDYLEDWNLWMRYAHMADFGYIAKTTSLYRTPAEHAVRQSRQILLDGSYHEARSNGINMINENPKSNFQVAS